MKTLKEDFVTKNESTRLHHCKKPIIGLTGGIGTGKSTVSKMLKERGFFIIDADELVHDIYDENETIDFVSKLAPEVIKNGMLDFMSLRKVAFEKKDILQKLEDYIYKRMPSAFKDKAESNSSEVIIYDVPLLFEKELQDKLDLNVLVYATKEQQLKRASSRDGCSSDLIFQVIEKQISIEDKKELSDYVIDNSKDLDFLSEQVELFLSRHTLE